MSGVEGALRSEHEHVFRLLLGPDGHGLIFGRYEGYAHRCACGENRPDYQRYLDSFHEYPDCGAQHRKAEVTIHPPKDFGTQEMADTTRWERERQRERRDPGMGPCGCSVCDLHCPNVAPRDEGSPDSCDECLAGKHAGEEREP